MFERKKVAMLVAEMIGTFALTCAVFAMAGRTSFPFFAALSAGLTLAIMVLVIGPISGSHINPAVTVGMWTMKKISTLMALLYIAAQFVGAILALRMNQYFLAQPIKNSVTSNFDWKILIAEGIGTLVFTFGIAAAVYGKYEGGKLAAAIGGSLFVGVLIASYGSNGVLNPAVALGIGSWNTAYLLGPIVGAILGMNLYGMLFADKPSGFAAETIASQTSTKSKPKSKKKK